MYVRMKVENAVLKEIMEACIHYDGQKIYAKIIAIDEYETEIDHKEFEALGEALRWLEEKCKELTIKQFSNEAEKGILAQKIVDAINENGFYL